MSKMSKEKTQKMAEERSVEIIARSGHIILVDTSREVCEKIGGKGIVAGTRIVDPQGYHGVMVGVGEDPINGKTVFWYLRDEEAEKGEHGWLKADLPNQTLRDEGFVLESEWEEQQKEKA